MTTTETTTETADDADRFRYEDASDCPDFQRRCADIDHRIRNDMQTLLCAAEEMFAAWAKDGLLDRTHSVHRYCNETKQFQTRKMLRSAAEAVEYYVACVRETISEARSLSAIEAEEIARGEQ